MVAISMYRGNLHKVPEVPRRWTMPDRNLSFKDFKSLLHRRKRALSRLSPNSNPNPNPNPNPSRNVKSELATDRKDAIPSERPGPSGKQKLVEVKREEVNGNQVREEENGIIEGARAGGGDRVMELLSNNEGVANDKAEAKETAEEVVPSEIEKEEKQVEERLQVLNAKKHNLVQVLKLILNAEEELKRRSSITQQPGTTASRPSLPLHVDVSNDSGGNAAAHMEGGETNDAGNHNNAQTPSVLRLCGASSSSESPLRRAAAFSQHNMASHPSRWSPRVGPTQPGNPSAAAGGGTVSASGTNYIASSPSPAGSGGTSVFRETRLQSPGN
ncbi:PREDICTED: uncharacterized protein LOC106331691 [Brassica oleracea var. oleracea]|uniref:uncharacterized protein LOC106331691 n=1 Tax=Brassica oleracea var. oleracea TaxID=109376 RepID=UPI0006A73655|nr:PREDICTED: uncharacterized protein LOC106331691 [Brassica oleracea var. oleracea]